MDVFNFLFKHLLAMDLLWVNPFLPELVIPVGTVGKLVRCKLLEDETIVLCSVIVNALPGDKGFEVCQFLRNIVRSRNQMQMVFHQDISRQDYVFLFLQESERVKDNLSNLWIAEKR